MHTVNLSNAILVDIFPVEADGNRWLCLAKKGRALSLENLKITLRRATSI